jgi:hypothetical protein
VKRLAEEVVPWTLALGSLAWFGYQVWLLVAAAFFAPAPIVHLAATPALRPSVAITNTDLGELDSPGQYAADHGTDKEAAR